MSNTEKTTGTEITKPSPTPFPFEKPTIVNVPEEKAVKAEELTETQLTFIERNAPRLGYVKKTKKLTAFQIFALICWISYLGEIMIIWADWGYSSVLMVNGTYQFVFNTLTFMFNIKLCAYLLWQLVLSKILNVLNQHFNPMKLDEEISQTTE